MKTKRFVNDSMSVRHKVIIETGEEGTKDRSVDNSKASAFDWFRSSVGSIVLHVLVLLLLAWVFGVKNVGTLVGERKTDEVGIVLSDSREVSGDEVAEAESYDPVEQSSIEQTTSQELKNVTEQLLPSNEIGLSSEPTDYSSVVGNVASGSSNNGTGMEGQGVAFGDVRGNGKNFVYILDRSDSMGWKGGIPMRRSIADAIASVKSLDPKLGSKKFQLLVYNHDVEVFEQGNGLIDITEPNKTRMIRFLNSLVATGGTNPEIALEKGIKMRPDVVFFLTDADEELSSQALQSIKALRIQYKVKQICVVEFGKASAPKKRSYRQLAGENNGTYIFKNIEAF